MIRLGPSFVIAALCASASSSAGCYDAVHDDQVAALGPETPGVPPGPTHRPGQPCLVCHGGSGPASLVFSVAGTIYQTMNDTSRPSNGANVELQDATGSVWHSTSNAVGNFMVQPSEWKPVYPLSVPSITDSNGDPPVTMATLDNRDGSCASCHGLVASTNTVGPVYILAAPRDGG